MYVDLAHPKFKRAETGVFTHKIVDDCMSHRCAMHATGSEKLDACCQHGCDVDLHERDKILAHAGDIRAVMNVDGPWFHDSLEMDPDTPSGAFVRTRKHDGVCIFLAVDGVGQRGCAIHRAAVEQGWSWRAIKPAVCQLFPLTYTSDAIVVSDDYADYSCAHLADAPTLYRVAREALAHVFGEPLVAAMDAAEARVLARRLSIV
jgi:Fe-S-cluster containining protein